MICIDICDDSSDFKRSSREWSLITHAFSNLFPLGGLRFGWGLKLGTSWNQTLRSKDWPCCSKMDWFTNESSLTCSSSISSLFPWPRKPHVSGFYDLWDLLNSLNVFSLHWLFNSCDTWSHASVASLILFQGEAIQNNSYCTVHYPRCTCFKTVFNSRFGCSVLCNIYQLTW